MWLLPGIKEEKNGKAKIKFKKVLDSDEMVNFNDIMVKKKYIF